MNLNTGGWASRVLTPLLRIVRSSPNATVPVIVISEPVNSETAALVDADIAIVPKGMGALLVSVPDGTATGGSKRGAGAVDLQRSRGSNNRIASGANSVLLGGYNNQALGDRCVVVGGSGNAAAGIESCNLGGLQNSVQTQASFIGGGEYNAISTNTNGVVCGGLSNNTSGKYGFIGAGSTNAASGVSAFVGAGNYNIASGAYSGIPSGYYGTTRSITGYYAIAACYMPIAGANGASQAGLLILGSQTSDATPTILASEGASPSATNQVALPNNSAYSFTGEVIAGVTGAGNTARWEIKGAIKRGAGAGTTAMVGTPTVTMTHNDAGASGWAVAVTANSSLGCIRVQVTGAASTTIRWVCKINTTEMTF
jgi:hypothetical protein